ncbi:DHS-like NAD/FAD-binding domain-containing protein [Hyaloscypha sp. PMI_1271]|nr:DHS-like NAD/FAD-binding domain-containing protein [Hyaloscypha sp. PMI_1271]
MFEGLPQIGVSDDFDRVKELLQLSERIVVFTGAGISSNGGFPTFQEMRKSKKASFDRSLYLSADETRRFHSTILEMFDHLQSESFRPPAFHRFMDMLARERRLLRHITQNFDCIEQQLPALEAKTIRLHGKLTQMRCQICSRTYELEPELFRDTDLPSCQECAQRSRARMSAGKRPWSIGRLKPDVLLCGEAHPDDEEIMETAENDMVTGPNVLLIVGTTLGRSGPRSMATQLCHATRRSGGVTVWISKEEPAVRLRPLFDYVLKGDCDKVTSPNKCPQSETHVRL